MVGKDRETIDLTDSKAFALTRETPFSYVCSRCSRCCHGKRIPLTPYDLIRLSEVKQVSTGELIREFTDDGVYLKNVGDETGPCVFLGPEGCTVHPGRPGACRVYPLGRTCTLEGHEGFSYVEPHPQTEGMYGSSGTIGDFVDAQELAPYFEASKKYLQLFIKIQKERDLSEGIESESTCHRDHHVMDVDAVVEKFCSRNRRPVPTSPEAKVDLHIEAVEDWLSRIDA